MRKITTLALLVAVGAFGVFATGAAGKPPPGKGPKQLRSCAGLTATISGTNGADTLTGTVGNDVIAAGAGADTITGLAGDDVICGGPGKDSVQGGDGTDVLWGGQHAD